MDEKSVSSPPGSSQAGSTSEDAHANLDLVTSTAQTYSGGTGEVEFGSCAEGLLPSIASTSLQDEVCAVLPTSSARVAIADDSETLHKSLASADFTIKAVHAIEFSSENPIALAGSVADATANVNDAAEDLKVKAQALVLNRVRSIVFAYVAKLPIVGSYFVDTKHTGGPNVDSIASETTPLLGALRDPEAFATEQAQGLLRRLLSPLLSRLPDVDELDDVQPESYGPLFNIFVECYALTRDGSGWLFMYLQEHSLVIAPTVSLGHLSTTDLAASAIGTAAASVTGYSIIQGFISSLDKVLAKAPNRRVARIACAQATVVTGVTLFPITNLWSVQSASILQRLGQPPEVAVSASRFLKVTAAGLPGYAIGEIAKRYLTSQGLSHVHMRILSATAPLNLILNYLLVNGPIPALRLGFAGAPLCTVLSHNALAIMLIVYIVQRDIWEEVRNLRGRNVVPDEPLAESGNPSLPGDEPSHDHLDAGFFAGLGALVFAGISGVLKNASQMWSKDFGGVVASILGPNTLATQAILLTTATTLHQAPKAISTASSDRAKKWMAKGNAQRAKITAYVAFFITLGGVIVTSNVLLASATSWGKLFNNDPIILQNVSELLPVIAIFQAVHGIGAWLDSSLGALGKTAVFPSLNASGDYFLGIPLGVYLALSRQWGLTGLWVGLTASLAYSCLVAAIVLMRTNLWKNVVGDRESGSLPVAGDHLPATS
ncbi:hypothetical protein JVU11DRAFT_4713 [Chiua virens]|nr:hypothetical protein JVU11DRAFT_4713 [Chiua virens]